MKPKIHLFPTSFCQHASFVKAEDYQGLEKENQSLKTDLTWYKNYCDRLVEHGDLPCLPKDLENLREANAQFAQDNLQLLNLADELKDENKNLLDQLENSISHADSLVDRLWTARTERNKSEEWATKLALEILSLKEEVRSLKGDCIGWENKWNYAVEMAAIAENKVAEKENQRKNWQSGWDKMKQELEEAQSKLDKLRKIL